MTAYQRCLFSSDSWKLWIHALFIAWCLQLSSFFSYWLFMNVTVPSTSDAFLYIADICTVYMLDGWFAFEMTGFVSRQIRDFSWLFGSGFWIIFSNPDPNVSFFDKVGNFIKFHNWNKLDSGWLKKTRSFKITAWSPKSGSIVILRK